MERRRHGREFKLRLLLKSLETAWVLLYTAMNLAAQQRGLCGIDFRAQ
jgi:hypothetical protein